MSFCVASMSTELGWETQSPSVALSTHLSYWFTSRENQGKIFGEVPSFYALWQKYGTQQELMKSETQQALTKYIAELFPEPKTDVVIVNKTERGSNYRLVLSVQVIYNGQPYDLARSVLMSRERYELLDEERLGNAG